MPAVCKLTSQDSTFKLSFCCKNMDWNTTAMQFSQSLLLSLSLSLLPGQKTKEHKGSTVPLLPQHQERRPTPHRAQMHLSGRGGTISFCYGQAKTPALVTKWQILPPFIMYLPKQEESTTGDSCVGSSTISCLGFATTSASDFPFQLSAGWRDYYTLNYAIFENCHQEMQRDAEQEH